MQEVKSSKICETLGLFGPEMHYWNLDKQTSAYVNKKNWVHINFKGTE